MARPPNVKILMRVVLHTHTVQGRQSLLAGFLLAFAAFLRSSLSCSLLCGFCRVANRKVWEVLPSKKKDDHNGEVFYGDT